jgi:serine/threonine protein kinase
MTDEELLADLMIQWEEALEEGRDVSAADLCKDCPHLVRELSRRIEALRGTSWMDKPVNSGGEDPPVSDNPPSDTPSRTLVNRYRLDEKVAEGGFAQVWKGYDLELLRTVAVKMPKPSHIGAVDSFMAEARRVARLKHPGIVPVHDVGKDGDDFFMVSEFVEDGSLGDRLKQGPIPPEQSCRWLAEIADALDYAHKNGVIHRDIKPANILIDHHGRALLADFGIALSANKTGQFAPSIGTLAYMSPEQLEGKPLDPRSDVYSVGVLLCQLLTGKLPYDARDTNSLRKEIVSGAIRLSGNGGTLSPDLRGICLKCLAHDPKERYATAKDLANDLRSVQPIKSHRTALVISGIAVLLTLLSVPFVWNSIFGAKEEGPQPVPVATPNPTNKTNADEALARGKRLFDEKKYDAALTEFTEAVNADGGRAEPYHRRAACNVNLQRYVDALPDFVKAVELDPSNPEIRKHHSIALSNLGRWDEAIAVLEAALKLSPADPTEYHDLAARNYSNRAKVKAEAGRWDLALPDLSAAIRHDPTPAIYHRQRGAAYFNLKQFEPAVADFTAAIEREPKEPSYYQFRGEAYKALGKQKEADADFGQARRLANSVSRSNKLYRDLAIAILERNGEVNVKGKGTISTTGELPMEGFLLSAISFSNAFPKDDAIFPLLEQATAVTSINFSRTQFNDTKVSKILGMKWLRFLRLNQTAVTDDGAKQLAGLPMLTTLELRGCRISDDGLNTISQLAALEWLDLSSTGIGDKGLAEIAKCKAIKRLHLNNTAVTSAGIRELAPLRQLEVIELRGTKVDDEALASIQRHMSLRLLDVAQTAVTDEGVAAFKKALPACEVRR